MGDLAKKDNVDLLKLLVSRDELDINGVFLWDPTFGDFDDLERCETFLTWTLELEEEGMIIENFNEFIEVLSTTTVVYLQKTSQQPQGTLRLV